MVYMLPFHLRREVQLESGAKVRLFRDICKVLVGPYAFWQADKRNACVVADVYFCFISLLIVRNVSRFIKKSN